MEHLKGFIPTRIRTLSPFESRRRFRPRDSEFYESFKHVVLIGLAIRLVLAPFTSVSGDVAVWWQVAVNSIHGLGLYSLPGFSYPPLFGYWAMAVGGISHLLGVPIHALGGSDFNLAALAQSGFASSSVVTTPLGTLFFKLPMILADVVTGWCVWRLSLALGASRLQARSAFNWWFFNPLVIFVSSVHGQIDSLVALTIAMAVLAALEGSWTLAGMAIAAGVSLKITPVFLIFPLVGFILTGEVTRRLRNFTKFAVGGIATGIVLLAPVYGSSFIQDVFTREGAGSSFGGLSLFGLLAIPRYAALNSWVARNVAAVNQGTQIIEIVVAVLLAVWVFRTKSSWNLVRASAITVAVVLLINPLSNPQYLVWIMPFAAVFASGVIGRTRLSRSAIVLLALGGILDEVGLIGWAFLLAPSSYVFGWPRASTITSGISELYRTSGPSWLPHSLSEQIRLASCVLVLVALYLLFSTIYRGEQFTDVGLKITSSKDSRAWLLVCIGSVVLVELFGLIAPDIGSSPSLRIQASGTRLTEVTIHVNGDLGSRLALTTFRVPRSKKVRNVLFFRSPSLADSNSEDASVLGTFQDLSSLLSLNSSTVNMRMVNAQQLAHSLNSLSQASSTIVVDVSGTLPSVVWPSKHSGPLLPWIEQGGILAFAGDVPGYYSVRSGNSLIAPDGYGLAPGVQVVGGGLLPSQLDVTPDWNRAPTTDQSFLSTALGLQYDRDQITLNVRAVEESGGTSLGLVRDGLTSEAFFPLGRGGVLDFAGDDFGDQGLAIANDLTHLIASNWFYADGIVHSRLLSSTTSQVSTSGLPKSDNLNVFVVDPQRPQWYWEKSIRTGLASVSS